MASSYSPKDDEAHQHKSRKPDNTAFKQQRLPAWQPILTAGTVLPAFFIIGLVFIPIGIGLFVTSNNIKEIEIDYTGTESDSPCHKCAVNGTWNTTCECVVPFQLEQPYEGNVFMYYGLSNFYQNHRRYVKSRDDSQLNGDKSSLTDPSKECEPYRTSGGSPIAPCGAIANSLFNDTLKLYYVDNGTKMEIPLIKKGIAWWTDKNVKFRNPSGASNLSYIFKVTGTTKPVNWPKPVYELDPEEKDNNGFINEDFIVWMRTAALPTFRKLYRLIEKKDSYSPTLQHGNYTLHVTYNYPVDSFHGRKRMILSTISWMGGKNPFLGIAYITVGSICFFLGVVLLIIHHKYGNRNTSTEIAN
ncbi:cell cycle control protein 50A-like isoform X1 [Hemitrygon akajei]|uniref:cell cycle control protein 50A-like isoform X1 n=1 Tax=Hemitrygon akajei TaxID=2704970 RepID=UPI003BFA1F11